MDLTHINITFIHKSDSIYIQLIATYITLIKQFPKIPQIIIIIAMSCPAARLQLKDINNIAACSIRCKG
jgi:hypothetical protein